MRATSPMRLLGLLGLLLLLLLPRRTSSGKTLLLLPRATTMPRVAKSVLPGSTKPAEPRVFTPGSPVESSAIGIVELHLSRHADLQGHVLHWVCPLGLAGLAEVKVVALGALIADSIQRAIAPIARDSRMIWAALLIGLREDRGRRRRGRRRFLTLPMLITMVTTTSMVVTMVTVATMVLLFLGFLLNNWLRLLRLGLDGGGGSGGLGVHRGRGGQRGGDWGGGGLR